MADDRSARDTLAAAVDRLGRQPVPTVEEPGGRIIRLGDGAIGMMQSYSDAKLALDRLDAERGA